MALIINSNTNRFDEYVDYSMRNMMMINNWGIFCQFGAIYTWLIYSYNLISASQKTIQFSFANCCQLHNHKIIHPIFGNSRKNIQNLFVWKFLILIHVKTNHFSLVFQHQNVCLCSCLIILKTVLAKSTWFYLNHT